MNLRGVEETYISHRLYKELAGLVSGKDRDSENSTVISLRDKPAAESQIIKTSPDVSAWTWK